MAPKKPPTVAGNGFLTKSQILAQTDLKFEDVDVPEWGGRVRIREMTGRERESFEAIHFKIGASGQVAVQMANMRAGLLVRCIVDNEGNRLFSEEEIDALSEKGAATLARLFEIAQRLNGMTAEDLETATKN